MDAIAQHFARRQMDVPAWAQGSGTGGVEGNINYLEIILDALDLLIDHGVTVKSHSLEGLPRVPLPLLRSMVASNIERIYGIRNLPRQFPKYRYLHKRNIDTVTLNLNDYCEDPEFEILLNEAIETVVRGRSKITGDMGSNP